PIQQSMFVNGRKLYAGVNVINGNNSKAAFRFNTNSNKVVQMKVALSTTGVAEAYKNLAAELPGWNFDLAAAGAKAEWNKTLSVIDAEGTRAQQEIFYTGLYRDCIQPNNLADVDGTYSGTDFGEHVAPDKQ